MNCTRGRAKPIQMDQQIVDPDPAGKNYNTAIFSGVPHFEMENRNIHRSRPKLSETPNCNAR